MVRFFVEAVEGTIDLTTGKSPVIKSLSTIATPDHLSSGKAVYGSPLTTMATQLVMDNADSDQLPYLGNADGSVSLQEFTAALDTAQLVETVTAILLLTW